LSDSHSSIGVTIVVRCRNNQGRIFQLYTELDRLLGRMEEGAEMVFLDEGSTDRTGEYLEALARKDSRVRWVRRKQAGGGSSVRGGVHRGLDPIPPGVRGEKIVLLNGSASVPIPEIGLLLDRLDAGEAPVVCWPDAVRPGFFLWRFVRKLGQKMAGIGPVVSGRRGIVACRREALGTAA
jgi:glycosyltransferase involved in cell wall biosynthesis